MEENVKFDKKSLKLVQGKTADFGEIAKECVAFANTYGGYLAIGIEDDAEMVREMAKKGELKHTKGRKYRRYSLL